MNKFFANIICAFVPDWQKRHDLRDRLVKTKHDLLIEEFAALRSLIKAQAVHKETFTPYKGIHTGQEVVLVATGPTLADYEPIPGAIHIGMNGAFKWKKAKLDYLFFADAAVYYAGKERSDKPRSFGTTDINQYDGDDCVKFYGIPQSISVEEIPAIRIPFADLLASGAKPFIMEYPFRHSVAYDLSYEPMGTYYSIAFYALQFALYTNAKRIYLVGTDCGDGHFYKDNTRNMSKSATNLLINDWKFFQNYIATWYPEVEVVSINPRGLRGLFRDIDTVPLEEKN